VCSSWALDDWQLNRDVRPSSPSLIAQATEKPVHGRSQVRAGDVPARRSRVCADSAGPSAGHWAQPGTSGKKSRNPRP
jgi:hypothetical protein